MLLSGLRFVRFLAKDINPQSLLVNGEEYIKDSWCLVKHIKLDSILDFSIPATDRCLVENKLLDSCPHSYRINENKFELLTIISSFSEFKANMLDLKDLHSFTDLTLAINQWQTVVIKAKNENFYPPILIVSKKHSQWVIEEPYLKRTLSDFEMQKWVEEKLLHHYFLQQFISCKSIEQRSLAFNLVVQQRADGAWLVPIVRAYISTEGSLASLNAGAEFIGTPLLMDEVPYLHFPSKSKSGRYVNLKLQRFCISLCKRIQNYYHQAPAAIGLRIAIDENLNPILLSIDSRTKAQSGPGRHLEFYKHLSEFAKGLAQPIVNKNQIKHITKQFKPKTIAQFGLNFNGISPKDIILIILQSNPKWVNLSIGHGSRQLIGEIGQMQLNPPHNNSPPFLSIKLGNALNDRATDKNTLKSIIALEEYLGEGIITWSESEYMRSARTPLLEKQWQQLAPHIQTYAPHIIWLEDVDLGLKALNSQVHYDELKKTMQWFETICQRNQAQSWGISFFNAKSKHSENIIKIFLQLQEHLQPKFFNYCATRMQITDADDLRNILSLDKYLVLLSEQSFSDKLTAQLNKATHNQLTFLTSKMGQI